MYTCLTGWSILGLRKLWKMKYFTIKFSANMLFLYRRAMKMPLALQSMSKLSSLTESRDYFMKTGNKEKVIITLCASIVFEIFVPNERLLRH